MTQALDAAIDSYLASRADTPVLVRQAMAAEPDDLLAVCLMGYLTRLAGDRDNAERSAALHRDLAARIAAGAGTERERGHVRALGLWLDDRLHSLMAHFETLLDADPTDILALRMAHYLYFYDGDAARMRDSVAARLADFAGHRLEGYVRGMLAFGHEEAGDYAAAERHGRAAVSSNAHDIWAAHAVAHVMEMQGRDDEGIAWIRQQRPHWQGANNFRCHLDWHEALCHLDRGDLDAVLALYDDAVAPALEDDFYLDLCNATSLLLRLEARGVDVGDRWTPLAALAEHHTGDRELVFASLHYLMPLLRTENPHADALFATLDAWSESDTTQGRVVREVALNVADFLAAAQRGDKAAATEAFAGFRGNLHRIGGSHAQRDLFRILAEAA
ncbi:MAG: tetratricopeptide repeat protein [Pseudomonadales bacterium]